MLNKTCANFNEPAYRPMADVPTTSNLCQFCNERPIKVKKYKICEPCYHRWIRTGKTTPNKRGARKLNHHDWCERLCKRRGPDFINDLHSVRNNPYATLSDLGEKHGITREYSRLIYNKYFQEKYTDVIKCKAKKRKTDLSCAKDPRNKVENYKNGSTQHRGAVIEKLFMETCTDLGLTVSPSCNVSTDLIVNGIAVEVKSAQTPATITGSRYFRYHITRKELCLCEFIAAYHPTIGLFYIIPNMWRGKNGHFIQINADRLPRKKTKYSGFIKYLNRFDFLMEPQFGVQINATPNPNRPNSPTPGGTPVYSDTPDRDIRRQAASDKRGCSV